MATKHLFAMAAVALLAGCTVGPNFTPPRWALPSSWNLAAKEQAIGRPIAERPVNGKTNAEWWHVFNDDTLNRLETDLATQNLDVQTDIARLAEARAQRSVTAADLYPTMDGSSSFTREKPSNEGAFSVFGGGGSGSASASAGGGGGASAIPATTKIKPFNIFQYGFDASWELDLWGGTRRGIESADATILAAEETRRDTLLSVEAELARDYLELRGTQESTRIARNDLAAARDQASVAQAQARSGLSSEEDTTTAEAQAALQMANLPQLAQQEASQINEIEMLVGQPPSGLGRMLGAAAPPPVPLTVPVEAPSDLLRRRPDIRVAEAKLHAATADIGVATADFYPSITLTGNAAIQGIKFSDLNDWAARTWSFGPGITLPIFEGGRLKGTLHLRQAEQKEAAIAYRQTVLQAMHDVDNALTTLLAEQQRYKALYHAQQQQNLALKLARSRYHNGLASFLDVTVAEQNLFSVDQQVVTSRTALSTNLIQLYKAMGGGIESNP